jgi:thiamine-monophosphate kinase
MLRNDESSLIALLTRDWKHDRSIVEGVGDDCAVLRWKKHGLLFKTDAIAEGVHFSKDTLPRWVGRKAIARVLSDFAAMGGVPWAAVVTLGIPANFCVKRLRGIYRGMTAVACEYGLQLVGGETIRTEQLLLSVAAVGRAVYPPILRSKAKVGDRIYVTGYLGESWPRRHLTFTPRLEEGLWLARHRFPSAMMDVSDGLGVDFIRLARASNVGVELDEGSIPRHRGVSLRQAMERGEDYELLFTVSAAKAKKLERAWPFHTRLTCVGRITDSFVKAFKNWPWGGYDHLNKGMDNNQK